MNIEVSYLFKKPCKSKILLLFFGIFFYFVSATNAFAQYSPRAKMVNDVLTQSPVISKEIAAKMVSARLAECISKKMPISTVINKKEFTDGVLVTIRSDFPDRNGAFIEGTVFAKGAFESAIAGEIGSKRCDIIKENNINRQPNR